MDLNTALYIVKLWVIEAVLLFVATPVSFILAAICNFLSVQEESSPWWKVGKVVAILAGIITGFGLIATLFLGLIPALRTLQSLQY